MAPLVRFQEVRSATEKCVNIYLPFFFLNLALKKALPECIGEGRPGELAELLSSAVV